jgi:hypothetical protein
VSGEPVSDDELVMRRVPPGSQWFEPPDRLNSSNFKLQSKKKERGLSVYRSSIVTESTVLEKSDALPGSFVVTATAGEIRRFTNAAGDHLRPDVIPIDDEYDPGHAEIRAPEPGKLPGSASKALRDLFARSLSNPWESQDA